MLCYNLIFQQQLTNLTFDEIIYHLPFDEIIFNQSNIWRNYLPFTIFCGLIGLVAFADQYISDKKWLFYNRLKIIINYFSVNSS